MAEINQSVYLDSHNLNGIRTLREFDKSSNSWVLFELKSLGILGLGIKL